jgi:hypothetical protein
MPVCQSDLEVFTRHGPTHPLACRFRANTRLLLSNDGNTPACHPLESSVQHRQVSDFGFLNFDQAEAVAIATSSHPRGR